jgi:hypothetical protein
MAASNLKLTKKEEEFCAVAGIAGVALSVTCLIQHLYFMYSLWITWLIAGVYVFSIIAFILMVRKHRFSPVCIIVNAALLFINELLLWLLLTFSPAVLLLMLYSIIMAVLIYTEGLPKKFTALSLASKNDEDFWKDKL